MSMNVVSEAKTNSTVDFGDGKAGASAGWLATDGSVSFRACGCRPQWLLGWQVRLNCSSRVTEYNTGGSDSESSESITEERVGSCAASKRLASSSVPPFASVLPSPQPFLPFWFTGSYW